MLAPDNKRLSPDFLRLGGQASARLTAILKQCEAYLQPPRAPRSPAGAGARHR